MSQNVFMFQSGLYCEECGEDIRKGLIEAGEAPDDIEDESSYDSDKFPKGPYANGGGEADTPQHCECCREFLENPLTGDGDKYVLEALEGVRYSLTPEEYKGTLSGPDIVAARAEAMNRPVLAQWARFYDIEPDEVD